MRSKALVGVRLSEEEMLQLERLTLAWGLGTRSEVLRELIHRAGELPSQGEEALRLPPMLFSSLEEMVGDGWADSLPDALARAVDRGLSVLSLEYAERGGQSQAAANALHAKKMARKVAEQRGARFLREGEIE